MIVAVLITSSSGLVAIGVTVGSSSVSPTPISPTSDASMTDLPSGPTPVAVAVLLRPPASTIS